MASSWQLGRAVGLLTKCFGEHSGDADLAGALLDEIPGDGGADGRESSAESI